MEEDEYDKDIDIDIDSDSDSDSDNEVETGNTACVVKFDTACSRNMSGTTNRIVIKFSNNNKNIMIQGFNGTTSKVDAVGINIDGKLEYFVGGMPSSNQTLLSSNDLQTTPQSSINE